jgi:small subunit ribosomal protein S9
VAKKDKSTTGKATASSAGKTEKEVSAVGNKLATVSKTEKTAKSSIKSADQKTVKMAPKIAVSKTAVPDADKKNSAAAMVGKVADKKLAVSADKKTPAKKTVSLGDAIKSKSTANSSAGKSAKPGKAGAVVEKVVVVRSGTRSKKVAADQDTILKSSTAEPNAGKISGGLGEALGSLGEALRGSNTAVPASERGPAIDKLGRAYGTGRRKEAVARVWIKLGSGKFVINKGKDLEQYFARPSLRDVVLRPFVATNCVSRYDVTCTLSGGGFSGQAGALRHGISRALLGYSPDLHNLLKADSLLTRDSRAVERKKYGRRKARRRFQFSKR